MSFQEELLNKIKEKIGKFKKGNYRFGIGISIDGNLYRLLAFYDFLKDDFDYTKHGILFSPTTQYEDLGDILIIDYNESNNPWAMEGIEDGIIFGLKTKFLDEPLGFLFFALSKKEKETFTLTVDKMEKINEDLKDLMILTKLKLQKDFLLEQFFHSFFAILKEHDIYTYHHSIRVSELAAMIGEELKLSEDRLRILYYAALIHDLGEIWIPKEILTKPGKLTQEEFEKVKTHVEKLENLFSSNIYLKEIVEIAKLHHEKCDGSGYLGLTCDKLPVEAKIIAICEIADALLTNRPFRKAMEMNNALDILRNMALNNKLDKQIINVALKILPLFYSGIEYGVHYFGRDVEITYNQKSIQGRILEPITNVINIGIKGQPLFEFINKEADIRFIDTHETQKIKIIGMHSVGYTAIFLPKKTTDIFVKWSIDVTVIPLVSKLHITKYKLTPDPKRAFSATIDTLGTRKIIFSVEEAEEKLKINEMIVLKLSAFGENVNLVGKVIKTDKIYKNFAFYTIDISITPENEREKLENIIKKRREYIKHMGKK